MLRNLCPSYPCYVLLEGSDDLCTRYIIELFNCVFQFIKSTGRFDFNASENICITVCMLNFVCLVLYILSYILCYFTMAVCQREHLYERLYV